MPRVTDSRHLRHLLVLLAGLGLLFACSRKSSWLDIKREWLNHRQAGQMMAGQGKLADAQAQFEQALDLITGTPKAADTWTHLDKAPLDALAATQSLNDLAEVYARNGSAQKGSNLVKESLLLSSELTGRLKQAPGVDSGQYKTAVLEHIRGLRQMAQMRADMGYYSEAESYLSEAISLQTPVKEELQAILPETLETTREAMQKKRNYEETEFSKIGDRADERLGAKKPGSQRGLSDER